jgi:hypothetical protein
MPASDKHDFDDTQLVQYLLGTLPAEESERLDELSVTDNDFAWRLRETENDLVDAYVRSELSGKTLEKFRTFYMSSAKRREKVAFAEELLRFQASAAKTVTLPSKKNSFFSHLFSPRRLVLQFAAAAFAMSLILGYLLFDNARLRYQIDDAHTQQSLLEQNKQELEKELGEQRAANANSQKGLDVGSKTKPDLDQLKILSLALPPPARGLSSDKTITVHPSADLVVLLLALESADFPQYRVTLKNPATNEVMWRSADLEVTSTDGKAGLAISFRVSLLKTQNYVAEVAGLSHGGKTQIIGDYPFHVVLK